MKNIIKCIILIPMWPLIWYKIGFDLNFNKCFDSCCGIEGCNNCCARAKKMVTWWRA